MKIGLHLGLALSRLQKNRDFQSSAPSKCDSQVSEIGFLLVSRRKVEDRSAGSLPPVLHSLENRSHPAGNALTEIPRIVDQID